MIKIDKVTLKQGAKGEYKNLKLSDGRFVNMFNNDIDYSIAVDGAELDRDVKQEGKWLNLMDKGEKPLKEKQANDTKLLSDMNQRLFAIHDIIVKIGEKVGCEISLEGQAKIAIENTKDYQDDIDPSDIPF